MIYRWIYRRWYRSHPNKQLYTMRDDHDHTLNLTQSSSPHPTFHNTYTHIHTHTSTDNYKMFNMFEEK